MQKPVLVVIVVAAAAACAPPGLTGRDAGAAIVDGGDLPDAGNPRDAGDSDAGNVDAGSVDAGSVDAGSVDAGDADAGSVDAGGVDAGSTDVACAVDGEPGTCLDVGACAALGDHTSTPGLCPGPAAIQCCALTPNVADNPPVPAGYRLMQQADVTPEMTTWAVSILHDPTDYPLFSTSTMAFGSLIVLARVEWHPPDFNNGVVHRGVTLYEPS